MRKFLNSLVAMCVVCFAVVVLACATSCGPEEEQHVFGDLIAAVEPTCETAGTVAHYHCTHCDKDFDADKVEITDLSVPAKGHSKGTKVDGCPASCLDPGSVEYYNCTGCDKKLDANGNVITDITILATGHHMVDVAEVVATCDNDGHIAYSYCDKCNEYYVDSNGEEISLEDISVPASHKFGTVVANKEATCTENGMKAHYVCSVCKKFFTVEKVETTAEELTVTSKGHSYDSCYTIKDGAWVVGQRCSECSVIDLDNTTPVTSVPSGKPIITTLGESFSLEYDLTQDCGNDWDLLFHSLDGAGYIYAGCIKDQADSNDDSGVHQQMCDGGAGQGQGSNVQLATNWNAVMSRGHYVVSFLEDGSVAWYKNGTLALYFYSEYTDSINGASMSVGQVAEAVVQAFGRGFQIDNENVTNLTVTTAKSFQAVPVRFNMNGTLTPVRTVYVMSGVNVSDIYNTCVVEDANGVKVVYPYSSNDVVLGENVVSAPYTPEKLETGWPDHVIYQTEFTNHNEYYELEFADYYETYDGQSADCGWATLIVGIITNEPNQEDRYFCFNGNSWSGNPHAGEALLLTNPAHRDQFIAEDVLPGNTHYNGKIVLARVGQFVYVVISFTDGTTTVSRDAVLFLPHPTEHMSFKITSDWIRLNITSFKTGTISNHTHTAGTELQHDATDHWYESTCNAPTVKEAHDFSYEVLEPATELENGLGKYTCLGCGYNYTAVIPATLHTPMSEYQSDNENHWKVCEHCQENFFTEAHTITQAYVVDQAATCTVDGSEHSVCDVCGATVTRVIAHSGHSYVTEYVFSNGAWTKVDECSKCHDKKSEVVTSVPTNALMKLGDDVESFSISYDQAVGAITNNDWTLLFETPDGASAIYAGCIKDQIDSNDGAGVHEQMCDLAAGCAQNSIYNGKLNSTWSSVLAPGHYVLSFNADGSVRWFKDGELVFYYYAETVDSQDGATMTVQQISENIRYDILANGLYNKNSYITNVKFGEEVDFTAVPFKYELNGAVSDTLYAFLMGDTTFESKFGGLCITEEGGVKVVHGVSSKDITLGEKLNENTLVFDKPADAGNWESNKAVCGTYKLGANTVYEFEFTDYAEYYGFQQPDAGWASMAIVMTTDSPRSDQKLLHPMNGILSNGGVKLAEMVVTNFSGVEDIIHGAAGEGLGAYWYHGTLRVTKLSKFVQVDATFIRNDGAETITRSFVISLTGNEDCTLYVSGDWVRFNIQSVKTGTVGTHTHTVSEEYSVTDEGHFFASTCHGPASEVVAHEFTYVETVQPTNTERGYDLSRCVCGKEQKSNYVEPTESHNFAEEWSHNETQHFHVCTDEGCTEVQGAEDHVLTSSVTTPATCVQKGVRTYTCSTCGYSYDEDIEKLNAEGVHTTKDVFAYHDDSWYKHPVCTVCGYTGDEEAVTAEEMDANTTSYDGVMNEPYWTQAAKDNAYAMYMANGVDILKVNAVKTEDGVHFYAVQTMTAFHNGANWWECDNVEVRVRPFYDFYDKYDHQLYVSTLNGGTTNTDRAYVETVDNGSTKVVIYEFFVAYNNEKALCEFSDDLSFMCGTSSGGWANCNTWRNIGGFEGSIWSITTTGIIAVQNPLLVVQNVTGTEILEAPVEGDCPTWNSNVWNITKDGSKDWTLKLRFQNYGWRYTDDGGFWPNYILNLKPEGKNQDDGLVFRADWWGWGHWNGDEQSNVGDACGVPDGGWYKAFMSNATVDMIVTWDADAGLFAVNCAYTWNVDANVHFWTTFVSRPIDYRGNMVFSIGGDHSALRLDSVMTVK